MHVMMDEVTSQGSEASHEPEDGSDGMQHVQKLRGSQTPFQSTYMDTSVCAGIHGWYHSTGLCHFS